MGSWKIRSFRTWRHGVHGSLVFRVPPAFPTVIMVWVKLNYVMLGMIDSPYDRPPYFKILGNLGVPDRVGVHENPGSDGLLLQTVQFYYGIAFRDNSASI